jgi:hypothetical protein
MTVRGWLAGFFPLAHLGLSLAGPVLALGSGNPWWLAGGLAVLYLAPPLSYRAHQRLWPVVEGRSRLDVPEYSPWWVSLQLQGVFNAAPWVEGLLRLVPGAYSAWLRLWGSRVGRGVVWTPRVEVSDRALLEVGDRVVFGHRVALYGHVIDRRRDGSTMLYLRRIRIGEGAFIGAGCRLGPGVSVPAGARLPVLTDLGPNRRWGEGP